MQLSVGRAQRQCRRAQEDVAKAHKFAVESFAEAMVPVKDSLETLEEIAMEAKHDFETAGGQQFHYIACLNETPAWIAGMAEIAEQHMIGWPTMKTAAQREADKKAGEQARTAALALGATN